MSHFTAPRWNYFSPRYCIVCKDYMGMSTRSDKKTCSAKCRKALSRKNQDKRDTSKRASHEKRREPSQLPGTHIDLEKLNRDMKSGDKFRLLDLCCCAGGAAVGYALAGFSVTGIDVHIQPDYPFEFIQANCLDLTYDFLLSFDAIHASPPCQQYSRGSVLARMRGKKYPDLYHPVKRMLVATGLPYIIENVLGSPAKGIRLYGDQFGLGVLRERIFESNVDLQNTLPRNKKGSVKTGEYVTVAGKNKSTSRWADAMGIHWTIPENIKEAIPPAYTEYLGRQLYELLRMAKGKIS